MCANFCVAIITVDFDHDKAGREERKNNQRSSLDLRK